MKVLLLLSIIVSANIISAGNILDYLPKNPKFDGSTDYSKSLQKAVNENTVLRLKGSGNPEKPYIYGIRINKKTGVRIPAGHILIGEKGAVIRRLPSKGVLLQTGRGCQLRGIVIDGNKKSHWPEFPNMGKMDYAIKIGAENLIENCYVYNSPGHAFATHADRSVIRSCKAKNSGYIDIKYKKDFFQSRWGKHSGDSFYIRGHDNILVDCDSEDAFRWDYTTCHSKSGGTVYINCNGRDVMWKSYGFIDIEGCDGDGSTLINCKSHDDGISISTSGSILINCAASRINCYAVDNLRIIGCETFGGGLAVGGWDSGKNAFIRGGANPIVIGNIINRSNTGLGVVGTSDWSLSVFSTDGKGIAAGNVLNQAGKNGPGMKFDKVKTFNNIKQVKPYKIKVSGKESAKREKLSELREAAKKEFAIKAQAISKKLGVKGKIVVVTLAETSAKFIKDQTEKGKQARWYLPQNMPKNTARINIGEHWDGQTGKYHGTAWYFIKLPMDTDDQHICNTAYLLFGGVDSECKVWLNGQYLGEHKGWKDPFLMQVPFKALKWKDQDEPNILTVRVYTPSGLGGIYGNIAAILTKKE